MENNEEIDIIEELNKATEPIASTVSDDAVKEAFKNLEPPTFDDAEDEDDKEDKEVFKDAEVVDEGEKQRASTPEEKAADKRSAHRWVKAFNTLMKSLLPSIYEKKILHKGDAEVLTEYKRKKDYNPKYRLEDAVTADDRLYDALKRFETLEKYIKDIPLTQDEMNDIAEPLAECIEKYKWMRTGPEGSLLMSLAIIMLPRLEPVLPNFTGFLDRMFSGKNN